MNVLLVCTGNTCRSPMAEALLRRALSEAGAAHEVTSAGTAPWDGAPASEGSYLVALEHGLDLSAHRARRATAELVARADVIFTMSRSHLERVEALGGTGKSHLLGEFAGEHGEDAEVQDPMGGEIDGYRAAFDRLAHFTRLAAQRLSAIGPKG
ncbi:MAG: low molecular weight protein arginine phosphatase [Gemmatimonadales bacterium]